MLLPMRVSISFSRSGKAQFWERESNGIISNNSHAVHKHRFTSMAREQVDLLHSACWIDFDLVNITELSASYLFLGVVSRARPRPAGSGARDYKKNKQTDLGERRLTSVELAHARPNNNIHSESL